MDEEDDSESEFESKSKEGEYMSDDDSVSSYESFNHIDEELNEVKKSKTMNCEIILMIPDGVGSKKSKPYLCLADTGSSSSLMAEQLASGRCSKLEQTKPTKWVTKAGNFETSSKAVIDRTRLPQFTYNRTFTSR